MANIRKLRFNATNMHKDLSACGPRFSGRNRLQDSHVRFQDSFTKLKPGLNFHFQVGDDLRAPVSRSESRFASDK